MSIDEEQGGGAVDIANRRNGTQENRAVAAVDERKRPAANAACTRAYTASTISNSARSFRKPARRPRVGSGSATTMSEVTRAPGRWGQPGIPQPRRSCRLAEWATRAVEAHADEIHGPIQLRRLHANQSGRGGLGASEEKSPRSRISRAAAASALTATHVRLPPTLTRRARFDDLGQGQFRSREHVHGSRDGFADRADLDRAS